MDFLEILTNPSNKFDNGFAMNTKDFKALRDGIIHLMTRVSVLEALTQAKDHNSEIIKNEIPIFDVANHDGPLITVPTEQSMKKRGRPKA